MARKLFTLKKTLVLAVALIAIGSIVWVSSRGPREPVFEGKTLTWWFTEGARRDATPDDGPLTREQLRSLGPDAIQWLGHKAGRNSVWDLDGSSFSNNAWERFVLMRKRWFRSSDNDLFDVRLGSIQALKLLGPEAAAAVPSLLKTAQCRDYDTRVEALQAIMATGDAGWPTVADAIRHFDRPTRLFLLEGLRLRWDPFSSSQVNSTNFVQMIELLLPLTLDTDEDIKRLTERHLVDCVYWWNWRPDCAEGVQLMLEHLGRLNPEQRGRVISLLVAWDERLFGPPPQGDAIIPRLSALVADSNEQDRDRIRVLQVLSALDAGNPAWPARLDELAGSSEPTVAEAAAKVLEAMRKAHREVQPTALSQ